ncbi:MAG: hypothetical protein HYY60_01140 [Parcubacteria group bacterium]|nr:hypothetical protein [Parcubacteria group bacterium]
MKRYMAHKKILIGIAVVLSFGLFISVASAFHSWGNYHWGRTANPFTLELGDNVSSLWDGYLATTADNWSVSSVLDTVVKPGKTKPRTCKATNGRVEVCSEKYGFNGWLGIAQIWVSGDHIVKGLTKVNDSYFNTSTYNTPAWRNLVMCQEVGHTLGLNHQDENFTNANLGTCMDYTNDPGTNQYPNQHDYDELEAIYAHVDGVNTVLASSGDTGTGGSNGKGKPAGVGQDIDFSNPSAWGQAVRQDAQGKNSLYARDLENGEKLFTFVIWAR